MNQDSAGHAAIKTRGLTKQFTALMAVDRLDLEIQQGEIFGFLGPNGAGKTTTIRMICGLLKPSSGKIFINGRSIDGSGPWKQTIGLCPQEIIVWPRLTCLEQLIYMARMYDFPREQAQKAALMLLERLGLSEKRNKTASTLSGGMLRRLNICLALIHDPDILVLDEPEAGLDPQSRVMTRDFIRSLRNEKTIILTTHNMDEADRLSDRIAIMDRGRLLLTGTPDNLKRTMGEGDVIEIEIRQNASGTGPDPLPLLESLSPSCQLTGNRILFRKKAAIDSLPEVISILNSNGVETGEVRMRANSLEDVFIQLTGRTLRDQ